MLYFLPPPGSGAPFVFASPFQGRGHLKQRGHTDFLGYKGGPLSHLPSDDAPRAFKWNRSLSASSHTLPEIFSVHICILSSRILTHLSQDCRTHLKGKYCPREQDYLLSEGAQDLKR